MFNIYEQIIMHINFIQIHNILFLLIKKNQRPLHL